MATSAESTTFEISGPAEDSSRFVRVEDVLRTHNEHGIRLNARHIIGLITLTLVICIMIYLLLADIVLDPGNIDIRNADLQEMYIKYNISNDSISLKANASLRVSFKIKGKFRPNVDLGTFNLTTISFDRSPIFSSYSSKFHVSGNKEQLLAVEFEPYQIPLPKEKIRGFEKKLEAGKIWIILDVDLKWHLKKRKYLLLPYLPRHIAFHCNVMYPALPIDGKHLKRCQVVKNLS